MLEESLRLLLAAALAALLLRLAFGRQPLADAAEAAALAATRLEMTPGKRLPWPPAISAAVAGALLGAAVATIESASILLRDLPSTTWLAVAFVLRVVIVLGVLRVPQGKQSFLASATRLTLTPWLLFVTVGAWAAYAYRAAAALAETPGFAPSRLLDRALRTCDALPRRALSVIAGACGVGPAPADAEPCAAAKPLLHDLLALLGVGAVGLAVGLPVLCGTGAYQSSEFISYAHRLWALDTELRQGELYPRLFGQFAWGFGYPFLNFYAPLTYYLTEAVHLTGPSFLTSVKLVTGVVPVAAGLAMYGWCRSHLGLLPALIAGAGYAASGYLLVDLYTRGDLAEGLCFVWLPLGLWAVLRPASLAWAGDVVTCAVPVALLMVTHNVTALLTIPVLAACTLLPWRRRPRFPAGFAGVAAGVGVSAFFWIPALTERKFVHAERLVGGEYSVFHHFTPPAGYLALPGEAAFGPLQTGPTLCFLALVGVFALADVRFRRRAGRASLWMAGLLIVALLMVNRISAPIWRGLPLLQYAQFPWRLGVFVCAATAYLAAVGAKLLLPRTPGRRRALLSPIALGALLTAAAPVVALCFARLLLGNALPLSVARLAAVLIMTVISVAAVCWPSRAGEWRTALVAASITGSVVPAVWQAARSYEPVPVPHMAFTWTDFWRREENPQYLGTTARAEYLPRWAAGERLRTTPGLLEIEGREHAPMPRRGQRAGFEVQLATASQGIYRKFFFPGWQARVDGHPVKTGPSREGMVSFAVPQGRHRVTVEFEDTPVRRWGWGISAITLLGLALCALTGVAGRLRAGAGSAKTPPKGGLFRNAA